jgi:hypothetical protein
MGKRSNETKQNKEERSQETRDQMDTGALDLGWGHRKPKTEPGQAKGEGGKVVRRIRVQCG